MTTFLSKDWIDENKGLFIAFTGVIGLFVGVISMILANISLYGISEWNYGLPITAFLGLILGVITGVAFVPSQDPDPPTPDPPTPDPQDPLDCFKPKNGVYNIPTVDTVEPSFVKPRDSSYVVQVRKDKMNGDCFGLGFPFTESTCSAFIGTNVDINDTKAKNACLGTSDCYAYSIQDGGDNKKIAYFYSKKTIDDLELQPFEENTTVVFDVNCPV